MTLLTSLGGKTKKYKPLFHSSYSPVKYLELSILAVKILQHASALIRV
jgi:hypothetical protein